jgi:hypothetical protein
MMARFQTETEPASVTRRGLPVAIGLQARCSLQAHCHRIQGIPAAAARCRKSDSNIAFDDGTKPSQTIKPGKPPDVIK